MNGDRLSGGLILVLGMAAVASAYGFYVPYQYEPLGPKAMPYVVGGLLILCGVRLLMAPQVVAAKPEPDSVPSGQRQWLLVVLLLAYGLGYEPLGFVVSSLVVCAGLARLTGAAWMWSGVVAFGLTLVGHLVLVEGLGLQLPAGLLQGWL